MRSEIQLASLFRCLLIGSAARTSRPGQKFAFAGRRRGVAEKRHHLYAPPDRSWSEERARSKPFSIGRNAGGLIAVNLSLGPRGAQYQTILEKCSSAKCLRSMEMKKIEAIFSSSRLSALCAELRGAGILAHLTTTRVQRGDHSDQRVSAKKNTCEAVQSWVKIELIVADQRAQTTAQMILRHAQAGLNSEGGHIIILDLVQSLQIVAPSLFSPSRLEEGFEQSLAVKSSQKSPVANVRASYDGLF